MTNVEDLTSIRQCSIGMRDDWTDDAIAGLVGQVMQLKNMPLLSPEVTVRVTAAVRDPQDRHQINLTTEPLPPTPPNQEEQ